MCKCRDCKGRRTDLLKTETTEAIKAYKVVRFYQHRPGRRRTIIDRCTEAEAQAHCSDPESSSSTCTTAAGKRITRRNGPWFDGYDLR